MGAARVNSWGLALQAAYGYRTVFLGVAHADALAQVLGGAHAGTHAAQRVGFQNGLGRATQVAVGNARASAVLGFALGCHTTVK